MRLALFGLMAGLSLAACERGAEEAQTPLQTQDQTPAQKSDNRADIPVSDELPDLDAPATGIAFWDHPSLSFNSMMIIANAQGAVAYNMEDGAESARIDGVNASGAAVSYIGRGAQAAGVLALYSNPDKAFKFYGVDNVTRALIPIAGGVEVSGNVLGFCFGRAVQATAPSLFVLRSGAISIFNFTAAPEGLALVGETEMDALGNPAACAVDRDGYVVIATDDGDLYRLNNPAPYENPLASAPVSATGGLAIVYASHEDEESGAASVSGQLLIFDKSNGAIHVHDAENGAPIGIVSASATDQLAGVSAGTTMGASGANLGALYRNGVIAIGVEQSGGEASGGEEGPAVRLLPYNGVLNAFALHAGTPVPPRGQIPQAEDQTVIIQTDFSPE